MCVGHAFGVWGSCLVRVDIPVSQHEVLRSFPYMWAFWRVDEGRVGGAEDWNAVAAGAVRASARAIRLFMVLITVGDVPFSELWEIVCGDTSKNNAPPCVFGFDWVNRFADG